MYLVYFFEMLHISLLYGSNSCFSKNSTILDHFMVIHWCFAHFWWQSKVNPWSWAIYAHFMSNLSKCYTFLFFMGQTAVLARFLAIWAFICCTYRKREKLLISCIYMCLVLIYQEVVHNCSLYLTFAHFSYRLVVI